MSNITSSQLKEALSIRVKIETLETELSKLLGESGPSNRGISLAGRRKIARAQKLRWAKHNAGKSGSKKSGKRKMSAAGRAKIAAAARKRWAKVKAAGKNRL